MSPLPFARHDVPHADRPADHRRAMPCACERLSEVGADAGLEIPRGGSLQAADREPGQREAPVSDALRERLGGPFIDAHAHLFPDRLLAAIWRAFRQDGYDLWHEGDTATIAASLRRTGADHVFLLTYAHKPGVAASINAWLHDVTASQRQFVPFGCVHAADPDREALVTTCLEDYRFAGLKLHCSVQRTPCDDPRLDPVYRLVAAHRRAVVIHAGSAPYHDPFTGVAAAQRLVERHPDVTVIFAHLGLWDVEAFGDLARQNPNVYLDCSSVLAYPRFEGRIDPAWLREHLLGLSDKILWGSDFPFLETSYAAPLAALCDLDLPNDVVARIRHGNARRLLRNLWPE